MYLVYPFIDMLYVKLKVIILQNSAEGSKVQVFVNTRGVCEDLLFGLCVD